MSSTATRRLTPTDRVARAYRRIAAADRPEVWIGLRPEAQALADAVTVEERMVAGESLPLAGATLAVKDNINVAGMPTTAGCPSFGYVPADDAPAVARLKEAGAVVLGKTNLDQFATGLVGTRSPYGAVRDARDPARVAGGSSSGSAVAVALGLADLALGTDTAGSGRIPAAFQGIVGIKPTRGLISTRGIVPACRSFDCLSVFARRMPAAQEAFAVLAASGWPADAPLAAPPAPRIAVAAPAQLELLEPAYMDAWTRAVGGLADIGAEVVEIDIEPFLSAGELLYGGAFVAERYDAVGAFIEAHLDEVDPTVASIILSGREIALDHYLADVDQLEHYRRIARRALRGFDALLLPTAPFQPAIADVIADPFDVNRELGTYTSFCNLLGLCAVAIPGGPGFGVTLFGPAYHDWALGDLASRLTGTTSAAAHLGMRLLVVGAHMSGEPLNHELVRRGARLLGPAHTAPSYRLYRLATTPPKPGLFRAQKGAGIDGELWTMPPAGLASLLSELPAPMALGRVMLEDGSQAVGFLCEPAALADAIEITSHGGWRAYLAAALR